MNFLHDVPKDLGNPISSCLADLPRVVSYAYRMYFPIRVAAEPQEDPEMHGSPDGRGSSLSFPASVELDSQVFASRSVPGSRKGR